MSFSRKTIIIDCGASRTALGIFSHHRGRLRLDRHAVEVFPAPAGPGDEWLDRTRAAFQKLRDRAGRGGACVLVLPGHAVLTKFIRVPRVTPAQRDRVIHFESEQNLPVALSELIWDSVVAAERETGLEVMLAASHLRKVEPLCAAARAAGFEPRVVLPASLATLAAFRTVHAEPSRPSLMISLGAYSTTFLFVEPGRFVLRTFALARADLETADPMGRAAGLAHRLGLELLRSVLHFRRQGNFADPEQVYLTGGGARLAGLRDALVERLKIPVDDFDLSRVVDVRPDASTDATVPLGLTELAGAALTQVRDDPVVANLLPPLRRRQVERRRRRMMVAAALFLIALPVSLVWPLRTAPKAHRPTASRAIPSKVMEMPTAQPAVEISEADLEPDAEEETDVPAFGVQLLGVSSEPYRLQLAGYLGGPEDYLAVFIAPGQPGTTVARSGTHLDAHGVELTKFEVKKVAVAHEDAWPMYEMAAEATLHDERAEDDVILDTRSLKLARPQATLRLAEAGREPQTVREGDDFQDGGTIYRVERIRLDPPEVLIARQAAELAEPEIHVLRAATNGEAGTKENGRGPVAALVSAAR